MTAIDPLDEEKSTRLRQRLWGAAVLIALLVIFLPLVLDGSGSESQYRRVERLREEPPRVIDAEGNVEPAVVIEPSRPSTPDNPDEPDTEQRATPAVTPAPEVTPRNTSNAGLARPERLQAWVVQAGSFEQEVNALAVRDRLRRAGYPSFVTPTDDAIPLYRVRVGPMISKQQAERSREKVVQLLKREAIVVSYP